MKNRRQFIGASAMSVFGIQKLLGPNHYLNRPSQSSAIGFPAQDPGLVEEMVIVSHGQIDRVKQLLLDHPELAKAAWDWGFGDWETAIGAASHVGNKEIAELLISYGARPDLFTFTMMGNLPVVKSIIESTPGIQSSLGPHGITLLSHAKNRLLSKSITDTDKSLIQNMIAYLTSLDNSDPKMNYLNLTDLDKQKLVGSYSYGKDEKDQLTVQLTNQGQLTIKGPQAKFARTLFKHEENVFSPIGALRVKIKFEVDQEKVLSCSIFDPAFVLKAVKL